MKIAAAYIRVSTDDQAEYSPASQIDALRKYAKANNMMLSNEFIFSDEGISGRKADKRPEFQRMISLAKKKPHPFDVILVWKFSRFARNREDSIVYKSMLKKECGIDVISISEQLGDDKTSILIEALIEAMDEYYSVNLAEEVRRGLSEKAKRGEVISEPPFGYMMGDRVFIKNPETAPIVLKMFEDFDSGVGALNIARGLNACGILTKRGHKWTNYKVIYCLQNIVYTGKLYFTPYRTKTQDYDNENIIISQGKHEPIVSQELFDSVNAKIKSRKFNMPKNTRIDNANYMLQGLVRCNACGGTLTRNNRLDGLQCNRYNRGECSVSHYISFLKINAAVIQAIKEDLSDGKISFSLKPRVVDNSPLLRAIENEKQKLHRIQDAYDSGIDTIEEYKERKTKIIANIKNLESQIKKPNDIKILEESIESIKSCSGLLENENVSDEIKNKVLKSFISKIILIKPENTLEIHYYLS